MSEHKTQLDGPEVPPLRLRLSVHVQVPACQFDVNPIRQVLQPFRMRVSQRASRPDATAAIDSSSGDAEPVRYAHVQVRMRTLSCACH